MEHPETIQYWRTREVQERAAAARATEAHTRHRHQQLAMRYANAIKAGETGLT